METPEPEDAVPRQRQLPADGSAADQLRVVRLQLEARTRELQRSEGRFRDVIERNADALVVVDGVGTIRFANKMATRLFGKRREELIGSLFGFPVVAGETTEVDLLARGEPRVAEMRVVLSEWEEQPAHIASLRDITERKRAEQDARRLIREQAARVAAEESAHRLRFLLESSTVLSSSLDYTATLSMLARLCVPRLADWTVVYGLAEDGSPRRLDIVHRDQSKAAAALELRGIPVEPDSAHPIIEALRTRRSRVVREMTDDVIAGMTSSPRELDLIRELGVESLMLVPMIARNRPLGAIAFVSSNPERRYEGTDLALAEDVASRAALAVENALLYTEAQHANQSKADFLAVVSHDLRTPLNAVIGYADLLEMGVSQELHPPSREHVQRIRTSAKHLLYLLNELLSYARLDAGRESAKHSEIDVREVVRDVAQVVEPLTREKALALRVEMPEHPLTLSTDPGKLRQVLLNLAGNAVKYTRTGEVRIVVRPPADGRVELSVTDTGDGIEQKHLERIFEPFWQLDPSQRSRGGGTGLGLSVVRRLSTLLEAEVMVESDVGNGSTFTVSLPE